MKLPSRSISLMLLFCVSSIWAQTPPVPQTPVPAQPAQIAPQPEKGQGQTVPQQTKKPQSKIDYLLELSRIDTFEGAVPELWNLEKRKAEFPEKLWPMVKEAAEFTQKGPDIHAKIKEALKSSLTLKDLEEIEAFFKDPKVSALLASARGNMESYYDQTEGIYGSFIRLFILESGPNTPKRSYVYLVDSEFTHQADLNIIVAKVNNIIKAEVTNLNLPKNQKSDAAVVTDEIAKVNARIMEEKVDELMYFYKDVSTDELRQFMIKARHPSVVKFYETIYLTASDSLLELGKRFVGKIREVHRAKIRSQI